MKNATSSDGTFIALDLSGKEPAVVPVDGALDVRSPPCSHDSTGVWHRASRCSTTTVETIAATCRRTPPGAKGR